MMSCFSQSKILNLFGFVIVWSGCFYAGLLHQDNAGPCTLVYPPTAPAQQATDIIAAPLKSVHKQGATTTRKRRRVVIAGAAKSNEKWLEPLRQSLVRMLRETEDTWDLHRLVIYENDSDDKTPDVIRSWNCTRKDCPSTTDADAIRFLGGKVELISEKWGNKSSELFEELGVDPKTLHNRGRTVKLAYARNRILTRLRNLYLESPFDYVLMLDLDEINVLLHGVDTCFTGLPEGFGACCANQHDIYYDMWALRSSGKYNGTIVVSDNYEEWLRCDIFVKRHCKFRMRKLRRIPAFRHIPASEPPISVHSCFGGAVVYDFNFLRDNTTWYGGIYPKKYGAVLKNKESVEHVIFHDEIRVVHKNFTMYIQPKMINSGPVFDAVRFPGFYAKKKPLFEQAEKSHNDPNLTEYYYSGFRKTRDGFYFSNPTTNGEVFLPV